VDNEVKEEVKVEEPKKKRNGLFTLFACVMTGIIVFLATNIGQKASKTVDPDTPKKNEVTSNVESNTTSNVASNVTSNTTVTEKIPASDLVAYEFIIIDDDGCDGVVFEVEDGTLYGMSYVDADTYLASRHFYTNVGNKKIKVLDNVKRIKSFALGSSEETTFLAILNDGTVKSVGADIFKTGKISASDFTYLKNYKVDDIISAEGFVGPSGYISFKVKLIDGTIKNLKTIPDSDYAVEVK
jgi:hypothetical protein